MTDIGVKHTVFVVAEMNSDTLDTSLDKAHQLQHLGGDEKELNYEIYKVT